MSVATELQVKPGSDTRKILGPGGNRIGAIEEEKKRKEGLKKKLITNSSSNTNTAKKLVYESQKAATVKNGLGDSFGESCSCIASAVKSVNSKRKANNSVGVKAAKVVPDGGETFESVCRGPGFC